MDFTIEELTMNAWPSLQTIVYNGWIIRMASGYTKRTNSVNPIYSFENNIDYKINYCENIYRKNNLPVIFKIIECNEYKILDQKLETLNYEKIDLTSVQICDEIKNVKLYENIKINNYFTEEWKNCLYSCYNINNSETIQTIDKMLKNIKHEMICVIKMDKGNIAGCGYGVIERGFIGLYDIFVKEEYRGKGYGKEIVETILTKGKEIGIKKAYLTVVDNNTIAKNLYMQFGFKEIYKYWYRKKI